MKKIFFTFLILNLTGCATHQQFDCPYKEGARCLSVSEIDKKIERGEIGRDTTAENAERRNIKNHTNRKRTLFSLFKKDERREASPPSPLRTIEQVLSLWVAPYYTSDGTYHEASRLHFVATEASWVGVSEIGEPL